MRTKRDKISNIELLNKTIIEIDDLLGSPEQFDQYRADIVDSKKQMMISVTQYSKMLRLVKKLNDTMKNQKVNDLLNHANDILVNIKSIFEWQDGVLINALKQGGLLLIDEISLANDSVLERLNSVFETERTLVLAEKASKSVIKITAQDSFGIVSTMNPSGDFGKKELSPALRNRMTEIWVDTYFDQKELNEYSEYLQNQSISELKSDIVMKHSDLFVIINEKLKQEKLSEILFKIVVYYNFILVQDYNLTRKKLSIRDVLNFIEFYYKLKDHENSMIDVDDVNKNDLTDIQIFKEGIKLIIIDGFGIDTTQNKYEILSKLDNFVQT